MLAPHFMLDETPAEPSLGGPVKMKLFFPGLQLQAGRGCSGLIANTSRHLYSSWQFTEGFCLHPPLCSPTCCGCSVSVHPRRIWKSLGEITPYLI